MLQKVLKFITSKQGAICSIFVLVCVVCCFKLCTIAIPFKGESKKIELAPTKVFVDKNGITHSEVKVRELSKDEMGKITDSIRKSIPGRVRVETVTTYVPHTDTIFQEIPVFVDGDSIKLEKIDNYIYVVCKANTETKLGTIHLKMIDTLTNVIVTRKHLLKSNERVVDITNKSPYTHINEGASIAIKEPKSLLVVGPTVVYNPFTQKMQYGLGITFNLISIKTRK